MGPIIWTLVAMICLIILLELWTPPGPKGPRWW